MVVKTLPKGLVMRVTSVLWNEIALSERVFIVAMSVLSTHILLTKITVLQNELAFSHYRVRGLYFLAVVFAVQINEK